MAELAEAMKGWMYILECADQSYYTGSTTNLNLRLLQHQNGEGANHTRKHLPVKLVYFEEYDRIDEAFYREKQVQKQEKERSTDQWGSWINLKNCRRTTLNFPLRPLRQAQGPTVAEPAEAP